MGRRSGTGAPRLALALLITIADGLPAQGTTPSTAPMLQLTTYAPRTANDSFPPPVSREFRGVWIATVDNIDWPSRPGLPADSQKAELLSRLDRAAALHLNAIILQVRPAADALYKSALEPWSYFLTGAQGRPPSPSYDPLAFAVTEAHRRGLELHAWFNPFRAHDPSDHSPPAPSHVSRVHPSVVKKYGSFLWMDPGEALVRSLTTKVVVDVVSRYDIDGVHIDDYFYPYRERTRRRRRVPSHEIPFPDDRSFARYRKAGGTLERDDWRRQNVDLLVEQLYREVKRVKPWVKFGISPFGIWRPGNPPSVSGLDAYQSIFADSRKWITAGWADYFTPQLYWKLDAPQQRYSALLDWWRSQNEAGRHVWPGNYTSRVAGDGSVVWRAGEIVAQVEATRAGGVESPGNVHFSMAAFMVDRDSLVERLLDGPYRAPALVPSSPWLASGIPSAPIVKRTDGSGGIDLTLEAGVATDRAAPRGERPPPGALSASDVRWWVVRARFPDGWRVATADGAEKRLRLPPDAAGTLPDVLSVSVIDRVGGESPAVIVPRQPPADGSGHGTH